MLISADIERGGCFAQMAGTVSLLEPRHRDLLRGFVINKFRGDPTILGPGVSRILEMTGKPVLGVIPYMRTLLPPEDSLDSGGGDVPLEDAINYTARTVKSALDMDAVLGMLE